jgi:hypothetical protein
MDYRDWRLGQVHKSGSFPVASPTVVPKVTPVKWYNLEYSPRDNGKPVLYNDMAIGNFIALLFEMSNELDKLEAPII